jgi:OFA family oxalate/formate antiporter-like MFS transporter
VATRDQIINRWWQLAACMLAMVAIASPQYTWTLFTVPLSQGLQVKLSDVQVAFTLFILTQSWLVPGLGYVVDRLGATLVVGLGGLLVAMSWIGSGLAYSLHALYGWYLLGGIGVGGVYGACTGIVLKWFPDRRGLAAGLVVGAYGSGAFLTVIPIQRLIEQGGYRAAFIMWGAFQGLILIALAWFLSAPYPGWSPPNWDQTAARLRQRVHQSARSYTPGQMLRCGAFYVMYALSVLVTFGGLMVTAQLKPMAAAYGLDAVGILPGVTALTLALMLNLAVGGLARPLWGWLSDRIGRFNTMAIAFTAGAGAIFGLLALIARPGWFVAMCALTVLTWGSTFVLFSAATGDIFGSQYAATNNGIQYTAKGVASIFAGWGAARLLEATGSWTPVLWAAVGCNLLAAVLAFFFLRPMVARMTAE